MRDQFLYYGTGRADYFRLDLRVGFAVFFGLRIGLALDLCLGLGDWRETGRVERESRSFRGSFAATKS